MPESEDAKFESWAIVDLLGHRRYAGKVTEEERFGAKLGRVDVPDGEGGWSTVYFGGGSVYQLIPTTEEAARVAARRNQPDPVHLWELPEPEPAPKKALSLRDDDDRYQADDAHW